MGDGYRGYRDRGPMELYAVPLELDHHQHPPCLIPYTQCYRGWMPPPAPYQGPYPGGPHLPPPMLDTV